MTIKFHHLTTSLIVFLIITTLTACGGNRVTKKQAEQILVDARNAYDTAKRNTVTSPSSLQEAEKVLSQAEIAQSTQEVEHLAYIAKRKAEIAVVVGERVAAENQRAQLVKDKDQTLIRSREFEAEKAWQAAHSENTQKRMGKKVRLSELEGKQTAKGTTVVLGDMLFETAKSDLLPKAMKIIDKVAAFLASHPDRNILVEGHTDNKDTSEYNMGLSDRRANSVRFMLIKKGVASNRIVARGLGGTFAIASNQTAAGRKKNRRVEITILNQGEMFR